MKSFFGDFYFVATLGSFFFSLNANQKTQLEKLCIFFVLFPWFGLFGLSGNSHISCNFLSAWSCFENINIPWKCFPSVLNFFHQKIHKIKIKKILKRRKLSCYGKQFKHKVYNFFLYFVGSVQNNFFISFLIGFQEAQIAGSFSFLVP